MFVSRWTVDYGDGPQPIVVPHAWNQDVSVEWEGPAIYRAEVDVPRGGGTLRFWGVSYAAEVFANGVEVARHAGIWDAFDAPLPGGKVELEVRVVKNGGPTYPVGSVASGGLPYLFNTFGGIYREVELLEEPRPLHLPPPEGREPLPYVRGVVHRGWYPDLGHPNPDEHLIRKELREIKALGFNLVKFAGWVPPHRYLDLLESEGLLGWIVLPLGGMDFDLNRVEEVFAEVERIVLQYRHHPSLVVWTLADLFGNRLAPAQRAWMTETIQALTGSAWVTDCPRGDFENIGTFDEIEDLGLGDIHLDSLAPGVRASIPILLGEYATAHAHRDLARLGDELPFWASSLPELNALGRRYGSELSWTLERSRFANEPTKSGHRSLMASSRAKEAFFRKTRVEAARARATFVRGYAVAELRDSPVSSSGLLDDWGASRLRPEEAASWNGEGCLFPIPFREMLGRKATSLDPLDHFEGEVRLSLGLHHETPVVGTLWWRVVDEAGRTVARGTGAEARVSGSEQVGFVVWPEAVAGSYRLEAGFGVTENAWDLWVVERPHWQSSKGFDILKGNDRMPLLPYPDDRVMVALHRPCDAPRGVLLLDSDDSGTRFSDFWEGSALEFRDDAFWAQVPFRERWQRLLSVTPDATLDPDWLAERFGAFDVLLNLIDTSPYSIAGEAPVLVRAGGWIVTTLRPGSLQTNPAGCELVRSLMRVVESGP